MKAKFVSESINFKRGENPYKQLGLGLHPGARFNILQPLYSTPWFELSDNPDDSFHSTQINGSFELGVKFIRTDNNSPENPDHGIPEYILHFPGDFDYYLTEENLIILIENKSIEQIS